LAVNWPSAPHFYVPALPGECLGRSVGQQLKATHFTHGRYPHPLITPPLRGNSFLSVFILDNSSFLSRNFIPFCWKIWAEFSTLCHLFGFVQMIFKK